MDPATIVALVAALARLMPEVISDVRAALDAIEGKAPDPNLPPLEPSVAAATQSLLDQLKQTLPKR